MSNAMSLPLRSRHVAAVLRTLAACAGLALGAAGCFVQADVPGDVTVAPGAAPISLDADATLSATPGRGVGLFVEYAEGGHWHLFTACDTAISGASCSFDVLVSAGPGATLHDVRGEDLVDGDFIGLPDDDSIHLATETSLGLNGLRFDADPGAAIALDVLLDGEPAPRFVYAVSDGAVQEGVPRTPVDLAPALP
jgi:hypothetical protein